jgi:hypothetical protein
MRVASCTNGMVVALINARVHWTDGRDLDHPYVPVQYSS